MRFVKKVKSVTNGIKKKRRNRTLKREKVEIDGVCEEYGEIGFEEEEASMSEEPEQLRMEKV